MQMIKNFIGALVGGSFGIVWVFAGPITYVLCIVDTWKGGGSTIVKLLISITLDAILAAIWPITWAIWGFQKFFGYHSPIDLLF